MNPEHKAKSSPEHYKTLFPPQNKQNKETSKESKIKNNGKNKKKAKKQATFTQTLFSDPNK